MGILSEETLSANTKTHIVIDDDNDCPRARCL
ncbi:BnaA06g14940D [Brassica napus]|uniref:BnaA06g14940D protein n=1 Tax=Brassica napus TaxID=3708 RepID=A0A078GVB9_BRANA|nr:BnaA06g14940D [Brassica napus]